MVSIKSSLVLLVQGLTALTYAPITTTTATTSTSTSTTTTNAPYITTTTSGYVTPPTGCPPPSYERVNITSPNTIKAGQNFTITWKSPIPDKNKNHTEARVEIWAMNAGPVNSPMMNFKSDRLFDTSNFTYNFNTNYVNATTKGGPIIWQLFVAVYSTYFDRNITDIESWNLPYYGTQKIKFE
jgi:hypothetical protein